MWSKIWSMLKTPKKTKDIEFIIKEFKASNIEKQLGKTKSVLLLLDCLNIKYNIL